MTLAAGDFAQLLLAVGLLLGAAHAVGHLFTLARQPRVIGEIMGGLLLGPTVLGALAPELQATLFPSEGPVAAVLGWNYQIGLLLLMFASGAEMRSVFRRGETRVVGLVTVVGVVLPFVAGLLLFRVIDSSSLLGVAQNDTALLLVFGLAIAVTSIPVISRIMFDLGIIETPFARIVLGVAVIEDALNASCFHPLPTIPAIPHITTPQRDSSRSASRYSPTSAHREDIQPNDCHRDYSVPSEHHVS
jgi:Kef-type K+ transport system membrane component KefB